MSKAVHAGLYLPYTFKLTFKAFFCRKRPPSLRPAFLNGRGVRVSASARELTLRSAPRFRTARVLGICALIYAVRALCLGAHFQLFRAGMSKTAALKPCALKPALTPILR